MIWLVFLLSVSLKQTSCQIAIKPHMDFEKIDDIMLHGTKYRVLRPTVHLTRDHFKDFIQKRHNSDFPGRKIFLDRNGFRHYWTGFEDKRLKSLRKDFSETNKVINGTDKVGDSETNVTEAIEVNNNSTSLVKDKTDVKEVKLNKPRRKPKLVETAEALRKTDGRTKVRTTFFCPFFGVITMISYID